MASKPEKFQIQDGNPTAPCSSCKHRIESVFCKAFPDGQGIPNEILVGLNQHRDKYPGDNGITYKAK